MEIEETSESRDRERMVRGQQRETAVWRVPEKERGRRRRLRRRRRRDELPDRLGKKTILEYWTPSGRGVVDLHRSPHTGWRFHELLPCIFMQGNLILFGSK